ncbi:MAG: hypothetical protein WD065_17110, partial [Planctomycetaceae bacterium]
MNECPEFDMIKADNMNELSTFLFARPTAWEGISRLVDFGDTLDEYNSSPNGEQADLLAIWADWTVVGNDIRSAWHDHISQIAPQSINRLPLVFRPKGPASLIARAGRP